MEKLSQSWLRGNCKFAGTLAGTPHGDANKGICGYSRVYDMTVHYLEHSLKLTPISKAAHVSSFGLSKDAPEDQQIMVSWGGREVATKAIQVLISELDIDRPFSDRFKRKQHGFMGWAMDDKGRFVVECDKLHNYLNDREWLTIMHGAEGMLRGRASPK